MKGTASYLMKFLDGSQKRFIIPVYQRNYDWKQENCRQLFDDLVSVVREKKETHFFGSITLDERAFELITHDLSLVLIFARINVENYLNSGAMVIIKFTPCRPWKPNCRRKR